MITIKRGDTRPTITLQLTDNDEPISLASASGVLLNIESYNGQLSMSKSMNIVDENTGIVSYTFLSGETDLVGEYKLETQVTWDSGGIQTFPNNSYIKLIIMDDLG